MSIILILDIGILVFHFIIRRFTIRILAPSSFGALKLLVPSGEEVTELVHLTEGDKKGD